MTYLLKEFIDALFNLTSTRSKMIVLILPDDYKKLKLAKKDVDLYEILNKNDAEIMTQNKYKNINIGG